MGFWNEYRESVFDVPPLPPPSGATKVPGGAGASPVASGTPKPEARSQREAGIHAMSNNQLQVALAKHEITEEEIAAVWGPNKIIEVKNDPLSAANIAAINSASPSTNLPAAPTAIPPTATPIPLAEAASQITSGATATRDDGSFPFPPPTDAATGATSTATAMNPTGAVSAAGGSSSTVGPGGRTLDQVRGTQYVNDEERAWYLSLTGGKPSSSASGTAKTSSPSSGSGGASGGGGIATPEPAVVPNSAQDFQNRGALGLKNNGGTLLLNGQQYRNNTTPIQNPADKLWYNTGPDGQPQGAGFKSETAANLAQEYTSAGTAVTSKLGNSPLAKGAAQGGFSRTFAPEESNFRTIGMDQQIAAGATAGNQRGDILGTISNNTKTPLDITLGGISEGGGITPVGNNESFTGQIPGGPSIGMSSILGNNGVNTQYWLSQMSGLPPSEIAKLKINTPEKALQFQQGVETARATGMMPNFASLYATNEPAGHPNLSWGEANGGDSNTPYDQALAGFKNTYLDSPDLTYLPDVVPSGAGSTQIGNVAYGSNMFEDPNYYAKGGQFTTDGPLAMVDMSSGQTKGIAGEAGPEKVTIDPRNAKAPSSAQSLGGIQPFAAGGQIWTGHPEQPQALYEADQITPTEYGRKLGYNSKPLTYNDPDYLPQSQRNAAMPAASVSGQPVQASYDHMGPEQKAQFEQGQYSQISPQPTSYQQAGGQVLPVYDDLAYDRQSMTNSGVETREVLKPINVGGVPALLRTYEYSGPPIKSASQQDADAKAYLIAQLNGSPTGNLSPGAGSFAGKPTDRTGQLAALYDLDPKAAMLYAAQGNSGGQGQGSWGGGHGGQNQDRNIENEAMRKRQYDINARNYARAGMPSPTLLDIPREEWNGEGTAPTGEAPYQRYNRPVQNGYALPFDYEVGSPFYNRGNQGQSGGWGGGYGGGQGGYGGGSQGPRQNPRPQTPTPHTPRPGGAPWGGGQGGNNNTGPWFNQLPWWARNARRYGPPVGTGMAGSGA